MVVGMPLPTRCICRTYTASSTSTPTVCRPCCRCVSYFRDWHASPHQVYLSYLDSVKYFHPENVMAYGCPNPNTSLRTFVYHQLQV